MVCVPCVPLGNISSYSQHGTTYTYNYDDQNQLISQSGGGKTYTYTYNNAGNILTASNGTTINSYTYGNALWKDQLTAFNGQTITYDGSGNPLSYYNGKRYTFTWEEGRNLVSAAEGTNTYTYAYDSSGLRISKTVNGVKHEYLYASGRLLRETVSENGVVTAVLDFVYDHSGHPFALNYTVDGTTTRYYYITNLQGDVLAMITGQGVVVASYSYDPYGKVISATKEMADINPLRYRGYYYDAETGFYYLQSRYYDPSICRFINADSYVSTGQGNSGNNMFAYCLNSPLTYSDDFGSVASPLPSLLEYYAIHKMVQCLIVWEYGYAMEVYVIGSEGTGYLDLYDPIKNQYYEVKSFAQWRTEATENQMEKYNKSFVVSKFLSSFLIDGSPTPGKRTDIKGQFEYKYWDIEYESRGDGVITYSVVINEKRYMRHVLTLAIAFVATVQGSSIGREYTREDEVISALRNPW